MSERFGYGNRKDKVPQLNLGIYAMHSQHQRLIIPCIDSTWDQQGPLLLRWINFNPSMDK